MEKKKDLIEVTCYNTKHTFKTKKEAIQFFEECLDFCDLGSCEAGRYMRIIRGLKEGKRKVSDMEEY